MINKQNILLLKTALANVSLTLLINILNASKIKLSKQLI